MDDPMNFESEADLFKGNKRKNEDMYESFVENSSEPQTKKSRDDDEDIEIVMERVFDLMNYKNTEEWNPRANYPLYNGCRLIDNYYFLNRIDEGSYGVVYRAQNKNTNEIVAIKRLKRCYADGLLTMGSLREIEVLIKINHENVVHLREVAIGTTMRRQVFIVMDYIENDLGNLMVTMKKLNESFTVEEIKCLLKQLLQGVQHLHREFVLHRDLKPSNILIAQNGILKIGDFGMCCEYKYLLRVLTPSVTSLWYRAPELLFGAPFYRTPVDMWSVGCIFGELIQMNPIFKGVTEKDQIIQICKLLGAPNKDNWWGFEKLPLARNSHFATSLSNSFNVCRLHEFTQKTSEMGTMLLKNFLTYDLNERSNNWHEALNHPYFTELPLAILPCMLRKWPIERESNNGDWEPSTANGIETLPYEEADVCTSPVLRLAN